MAAEQDGMHIVLDVAARVAAVEQAELPGVYTVLTEALDVF